MAERKVPISSSQSTHRRHLQVKVQFLRNCGIRADAPRRELKIQFQWSPNNVLNEQCRPGILDGKFIALGHGTANPHFHFYFSVGRPIWQIATVWRARVVDERKRWEKCMALRHLLHAAKSVHKNVSPQQVITWIAKTMDVRVRSRNLPDPSWSCSHALTDWSKCFDLFLRSTQNLF